MRESLRYCIPGEGPVATRGRCGLHRPREDALLAAHSLFAQGLAEMSEEIARSAGSWAPLAWLYMLRILGTPPFFGTRS